MEGRNVSRRLRHRAGCFALVILTYFAVGILPAEAFWANLAANPNPNTGDFDVTWDNPSSESYTLQELPSGGSWTYVDYTNGTSHNFTGHVTGDFSYRLKHDDVQCSGWPEPVCYGVTTYSETISVTVNEPPPPPPGGGGDPFPEPGPFTPPDDSAFPDATIVNPSAPNGDNNVGALAANGGVSGGQASYSIPIVVPPGRKGMRPSVSLNYSSSSGDGPVGVGWNLGATSAITRCAATAATDGFTAAVRYDASRDRLCLDGQRLVVTSGTYGTSGAEYRTELDQFARVRQFGAINNATTWFIVDYKNGRTGSYGATPNTRHSATGRTEVLTWAIRTMRDTSGNSITYEYFDYGDGEYPIKAIHYTGINGSDGDRHVRFAYEPKTSPRTFYLAGGKSRATQRLKDIRTEYQTTLIRKYSLTYTPSQSTSRDVLTSIQECAYENGITARCLPTTDFEWQVGDQSIVVQRLQFFDPNNLIQGDAGTDPGAEIVHDDKRALHQVLPRGDTNGDGVKDWDGIQVNAEGQITDIDPISLDTCFKRANGWGLVCLAGDFNADGRTDSFRQNNNKFELSYTVDDGQTPIWINTGLDWRGGATSTDDAPLGFGDFNGDGYLDIAFRNQLTLYVYFHTQNFSAPFSTASRQQIASYAQSGVSYTPDIQIYGDMDGNGTPDFVVSDIPGSGDTPGLPIPDYIILTQSESSGGMTTSTRNIPEYTTQMVNGNFIHDVNSDGLPDVMSINSVLGNLQYILNDGTGFPGPWIDLGVQIPVRLGTYEIHLGEQETYTYPVMSKILVMDYDGDGWDEILYAGSGTGDILASGCAEVQQPMPPGPEWKCDDDLYDEYTTPYALTGGPINADVLDNSVRRYRAIQFDETPTGIITATDDILTDIVASASQTAAIDATGDGLVDIVTVFGCRTTPCEFNNAAVAALNGTVNSTYVEGAWINRNTGSTADISGNGKFDYAAQDLMSAAEDAFGNRHEWDYRPLSSDEYDTAVSDYYRTTHSDELTDPDYFHFASSMYVVADHRASNGIGGLNSTKYRYRSAIFNNQGRGFQGFRSIIVEEDIYPAGHGLANTDKINRTDFYQKWPESGQVNQACAWLAVENVSDDNPSCSNVLAKTTTNSIYAVATSGGARFVAVDDQTVETFDLPLPRTSSLTARQTTRSFDTAGNVTYESQQHTDDWGTVWTETTTNYVFPDWANWWLTRIDDVQVKYNPVAGRPATPTIAAGTDDVKITTIDFVSYDTTHRLPSEVKTTANDTLLWHSVSTVYNGYGLPSSVSADGTLVTGPRTVTTTYSNDGVTQSGDGYFPYTFTNILGHEVEQHTDPIHGQPINQWDANNLLIVTSFDAFGRVASLTPPGAPIAYQGYFRCDGAPACPALAEYRITTVTAGAPEMHVYVDTLGREIQTSIENFDDTGFVNVAKSFDARGNVTFESQPSEFATPTQVPSVGTRYLGFDALGRLTSKEGDQTNSQVLFTSYTHTNFTTQINAGGIPMHRIYNGLGQLMETLDGEGGYTRYAFDAAGNPILLQDPVMPDSVAIKAAFNAFGYKEWVEDPDWWNGSGYGRKSFTYSGLGEILSETDPNNNLVEMLYDQLGRLTHRTVNTELEGRWVYDNTDTYKGLGLLDYEDSQFRADKSRLQKFYYYSSTATGRKDLLQVTHRIYENDDQNDFGEYATAYFTDGFYARPKGMRYPGPNGAPTGSGLAYLYNTNGHLEEENDPDGSVIYRRITDRDVRGQVKTASLGQHGGSFKYSLTTSFYTETGQANTIVVNNGSTNVQDLGYTYDVYGNLDTRSTYVGGTTTETFGYDYVQRLTSSYRSFSGGGNSSVLYTYDASGNFFSKGDYASSYSYHASRPHVVTSINRVGGGSVTFAHDNNGNVTQGDGENITYNAFNKPVLIETPSQTVWSQFEYGADLMRYRQEKDTGELTYYVDKLMEIITVGTSTDYRHYLSDIAVLTKTGDLSDSNPGINYTLRDRLGSVATVVDDTGLSVEPRAYDPFGKPRNGNWTDKTPAEVKSNITDRGFTDHEHLDDWQLIHMNGRGYDYNLGRFLSIDPIIQAPGNSQSLNPFAYIMNNPLSGTDPSGYFCQPATGTHIASCGSVDITSIDVDSGEEKTETVTFNTRNPADVESKVRGAIGRTARANGIKTFLSTQAFFSDGSGSSITGLGASTDILFESPQGRGRAQTGSQTDESSNLGRFDGSPQFAAVGPGPIFDFFRDILRRNQRQHDEAVEYFIGFDTVRGFEVLGREIRVQSPNGQVRVYDYVLVSPVDGHAFGIEVKSTRRNVLGIKPRQAAFDIALVGTPGGFQSELGIPITGVGYRGAIFGPGNGLEAKWASFRLKTMLRQRGIQLLSEELPGVHVPQ